MAAGRAEAQALSSTCKTTWRCKRRRALATPARTIVRHGAFEALYHHREWRTDQGKTSNVNALAIVAAAQGVAVPAVGLTTFRPPYTPVTFGTLAAYSRGVLFDPVRTTPLHDWAEAQGAVFEDVGLWKRARYFPHLAETMHQATARECRTVRTTCGLFDGSTLGKIEVVGPDAAVFLERMYVNAFAGLTPGRCRYGLMLGENGFVLDDGVIGRMAADRFHVTTTTGGAGAGAGADGGLSADGVAGVAGLADEHDGAMGRARAARPGVPCGAGAAGGRDGHLGGGLPAYGGGEGRILGAPMRLFRVSFTGEMGFEINVPAARRPWCMQRCSRGCRGPGVALMGPKRCTCCGPRRAM